MATLVSVARAQQEAERVSASASLSSPDTSGAVVAALEEDSEPQNRAVRPRSLSIPTTASVARQATIPDAIRLNQINLVGVYGAPSDRRALVRLSSGRYVKVKVGDRVDGGTVAQITDSELYYRKGNRTLSLQVPQG
jgi:type IV pilus biogenesis protein PilP